MHHFLEESHSNVSVKYDHRAFEEGLFVDLLINIVLHCIITFEATGLLL